MKPEIVFLRAFYEPAMAALEGEFTVHNAYAAANPLAYIQQHCANARAVISTTTTEVTRAHFEALPKLELLACYGPYVTLIDFKAAKDHNVTVTHTPDATAEPVADLTLGLIVAVMRRICEADRFVRAGLWPKQVFPAGVQMRDKTCGIVGMGRIGREIALRAAGFGMHIAYCGPRRKDDLPYRYFDNLEQLARESACLVVTCALTPETCNLINARVITALGSDGYLINVARGAIVDEPALIDALVNKKIAGAALDVFANEPHVPQALLTLDNVVLAPHMGTSTREVRDGRMEKLLHDVRAHFAGEPLRYAISA
ncbi:MAG: 2-hydroxyacid dehydrogenase [Betaproteobacteria bacterium]|nr:2-hydroxyacid dehydrogenase [Betaproteobacteria bacterium]